MFAVGRVRSASNATDAQRTSDEPMSPRRATTRSREKGDDARPEAVKTRGTAIRPRSREKDVPEQKFGPAEALRQSEERVRLMVEAVRDYAIFMLDPEGY